MLRRATWDDGSELSRGCLAPPGLLARGAVGVIRSLTAVESYVPSLGVCDRKRSIAVQVLSEILVSELTGAAPAGDRHCRAATSARAGTHVPGDRDTDLHRRIGAACTVQLDGVCTELLRVGAL